MDCYFAGGCFWCITPVFYELDGVKSVVAGFSGGDEVDPKYEDVKAQMTSHRETIKVIYDEAKVEYKTLLDIFFNNVDLFDGGGQFIDRGHSYTLAIYYTSEKEKEEALSRIKEIEKETGKTVMVEVSPFKAFYSAEEYHQDYYKKNEKEFEEEMVKSGRKKWVYQKSISQVK